MRHTKRNVFRFMRAGFYVNVTHFGKLYAHQNTINALQKKMKLTDKLRFKNNLKQTVDYVFETQETTYLKLKSNKTFVGFYSKMFT